MVSDLRNRFDDVLSALEAAGGWQTERVQKPVLILGKLDGILTGIRQLRRTQPLETEELEGLRVPTLAEMARIKVWILATRHTVRDYLDTVAWIHFRTSFKSAAMLVRHCRPFSQVQSQASAPSLKVIGAAPNRPSIRSDAHEP